MGCSVLLLHMVREKEDAKLSMTDCPECWSTPCECGYEYRHWDKKRRLEQAAIVLGIDADILKASLCLSVPEEHPMKGKK